MNTDRFLPARLCTRAISRHRIPWPRILFLLAPLLAIAPRCAPAQTLLDSLRPQPRQAYVREQYSAVWLLRPIDPILLDPAAPRWSEAAAINAGLRAKGCDTMTVRLWNAGDSSTHGVLLGMYSSLLNDELARIPDQKIAVTASYPGPEGYVLDVMPSRIILVGSDARGLAYGVSTLLQLLFPKPSWWGMQACRIIDAPEFPVRWFYQATNVLVPANITAAKALWDRSARCRLNGVQFSDYKFSILSKQPQRYFDSLASLKRHADDLGLEIVPGVMPFGYSNGLLAHDPNLASGLPVRAQRFVIEADTARLVPHRDVTLPNGGFETRSGDNFPGYTFIDQPGRVSFADTDIRHSGAASIRFQDFAQWDPTNGHGRVCVWKRVQPFTQYHVRAWVRTEGLQPASSAQISVLTRLGYSLVFNQLSLPATTGGWRNIDFTFNSLEADSIGLYFGVWGAKGGKIWWDDLAFEECAFVNLIRRDGAPLTVAHPVLAMVYREGIDFDTLRDARLGNVPYAGEYDKWHTPPAMRITPGGLLHNGDTVLVSYCHMIVIYDSQVMITMSDPKVYALAEEQFRLLDDVLHARTWFMEHDEIRTMNWDQGDQSRSLTPARILADNVRQCAAIIRGREPEADIWVWSDMFDEFHNAVKQNYYLVHGDLTGSADLIPKDLGIMNWNGRDGIVQQSLNFFSSKSFRQASAPYYDTDENNIRVWKEWTRGVTAFRGMMYTTWQNRYTHLEPFGEYAWNHAPYIYHNPPTALPAAAPLTLGATIAGDRWDPGWALGDCTVWYRTQEGQAFDSLPFHATAGVPVTVPVALPTGAQWVQWYVTASDNRGWTTKVPFGDSTYFELGTITTGRATPAMPGDLRLIGVFPHPARRDAGLTVSWSAKPGASVDIIMFDMLGRPVRRVRATADDACRHDTRVDLRALPAGVYHLQMRSGARIAQSNAVSIMP